MSLGLPKELIKKIFLYAQTLPSPGKPDVIGETVFKAQMGFRFGISSTFHLQIIYEGESSTQLYGLAFQFISLGGGVYGIVASESALRSAGTLLSRVRASPPAPRPDGGLSQLLIALKHLSPKFGWNSNLCTPNNHGDYAQATEGVGGAVDNESALRSARALLLRVRVPPLAPRPEGGPESLRSPCCGEAMYIQPTSTGDNCITNIADGEETDGETEEYLKEIIELVVLMLDDNRDRLISLEEFRFMSALMGMSDPQVKEYFRYERNRCLCDPVIRQQDMFEKLYPVTLDFDD
ncbi:hypothetical protein PoB_002459700 [Plakobranchus ocellatus]|uniref:EF-hand domain-containing protein n=1 Tax=Plakobranchus ocellatus TaxID=259542 RepID=A0AAV3ZU63_9GAST|nr:hypothetical protein PoB_002459700 [Plakobranchus ocellatus]